MGDTTSPPVSRTAVAGLSKPKQLPCNSCRTSKIRCDQAKPKCTSCQTKGKDCEYGAAVHLEEGRSRRFHRRSKNGCERCKTRRVRCDEARPVCRSCIRTGAQGSCSYTSNIVPTQPTSQPSPSSTPSNDPSPIESASREADFSSVDLSNVRATSPMWSSFTPTLSTDPISQPTYPSEPFQPSNDQAMEESLTATSTPSALIQSLDTFSNEHLDLIPLSRTTTSNSEMYWKMSQFAQAAFLQSLFSPQPDPLALYFPSYEQRQQYRHFYHETSHALVVLPTSTSTNPWLTRLSHMALGMPYGQDLAHDAFRYALLSIASFDLGYRMHHTLKNPRNNVMYATSYEQRQEALSRLKACLECGINGDDIAIELALATTFVLCTRDRLAGSEEWEEPYRLGAEIIVTNGGAAEFIAINPSPTRRFLVEQMACVEFLGCMTTFDQPKILQGDIQWIYQGNNDDRDDHLHLIYGWDRSTMQISVQVINMVHESARIELLRSAQAKRPYNRIQEAIDTRTALLHAQAYQFVIDAEMSRQSLMMKPLPPQVNLGTLAVQTCMELCIQMTVLTYTVESKVEVQKKAAAICEISDEALSRGIFAGLLLPLSWAAACGKGATFRKAQSLLEQLQPLYHLDHDHMERSVHFDWPSYETIQFDDWERFLRANKLWVPVF